VCFHVLCHADESQHVTAASLTWLVYDIILTADAEVRQTYKGIIFIQTDRSRHRFIYYGSLYHYHTGSRVILVLMIEYKAQVECLQDPIFDPQSLRVNHTKASQRARLRGECNSPRGYSLITVCM
jgi:hypothetical protein